MCNYRDQNEKKYKTSNLKFHEVLSTETSNLKF